MSFGLKVLNDETVIDSDQSICGGELETEIYRGMILLRTEEDLCAIEPFVKEFCEIFQIPYEIINKKPFKVIKPISKRSFGGNYCGQLI